MSITIPGTQPPVYLNNTSSRGDYYSAALTTANCVFMKQKNKKPYIYMMMSFFIISCIIQGYIPYTSYYSFLHSEKYFILNLVNFVFIFLIFAYGLLEVYKVKRLVGIFLIIQPFVFITELISNFAFNKTNMDIFHPILKLLLTLCLIRLADMFLSNCRGFIINLRRNIKPLLKALFVTLSAGIAVIAVKLAVNYLSITTFNFTNSYYVIPCFEMLNYAVQLIVFLSAIFIIWKILNGVSISQTSMLDSESVCRFYRKNRENKKSDIFICCAVIVLMVSSTIYYLANYGNKFVMYFQLINKIIENN